MQLTILSFRGVGQVEFGMSPNEVRERVAASFKSFKRSPQDSVPCDYFEDVGAFFYYDSNSQLTAVELAAPAEPVIAGLKLLELNFKEAYAALCALDNQTEKEADGAIAFQLGVSIYSPLAKTDPTAPVESVLAFKRGYYN